LDVLNALEEPDVIFGQPVGSCAIPDYVDIPQRRLAIHLITPSHVGDGTDRSPTTIFGLDFDMMIPTPWHPSVESRRIKSRLLMR
jgi:hypothetical protein